MASEEWSLLARMSNGVTALLDAGANCEKVATALLRLLPGAMAAQCQLDGSTGNAGEAGKNGLLTAEIRKDGRTRGQLAAALAAPDIESAGALLNMAARLVALQLPPHEEDHRQMMELVSVGEAAGWIVHALNNHLNGMVLQAACVQMLTQSPVREQAEQIRREGARAGARLRPLQAVRPWPAREGVESDLAEAVREVLRTEPGMMQVRAELPAEQILVSASTMGLKRMLTLLLHVGLRCMSGNAQATLRVGRSSAVELVLELPGVRRDGEGEGLDGLPQGLETGLDQVEREAVRWLVRQTGGRLDSVQKKEGLALTVRWGSQ